MANNKPEEQKRIRAQAIRWLNIVVLGIIGAIEYALLGPKISAFVVENAAKLFGTAGVFPFIVAPLLAFVALLLLHQFAGTRLGHMRYVLKYPPLPVAVILGCLLSPLVPEMHGAYFSAPKPSFWFTTVGTEANYWLAASSAGICYLLVWLFQVGSQHFWQQFKSNTFVLSRSPNTESDHDLKNLSDLALEEWICREEPIEDAANDLFWHRPIAERLLTRLKRGENTIALLGAFGCGKSTIAAFTRSLASKEPNSSLIFVQTSCWGFEEASHAQRDVLVEILREVGMHADCLSIRDIPSDYLEAMPDDS
jgi:hypothetical protein